MADQRPAVQLSDVELDGIGELERPLALRGEPEVVERNLESSFGAAAAELDAARTKPSASDSRSSWAGSGVSRRSALSGFSETHGSGEAPFSSASWGRRDRPDWDRCRSGLKLFENPAVLGAAVELEL
jgi:hypothetical protein